MPLSSVHDSVVGIVSSSYLSISTAVSAVCDVCQAVGVRFVNISHDLHALVTRRQYKHNL